MQMAPSAADLFESFLKKHHAQISFLDERDVSLDQIAALAELKQPALPAFRAFDDTLLYIHLLRDLFSKTSPAQAKVLIDLGAGSSLPTIAALRAAAQYENLRVIAVDSDPIAIEASRKNVEAANFEDRYTFVCDDMLNYLSGIEIDEGTLIAANVPYMPVPNDEKDSFYTPVDGGPDGTRYLIPLLSSDLPRGTRVALRWCSLSNPSKVIDILDDFYKVVHITAQRAPFGTYALKLGAYLLEQRERGDAAFITNDKGQHEFTFVSAILRRVR